MGNRLILLCLGLTSTLVACTDGPQPVRVTVTEVDSTGRLPEQVDPEIYTAGRLILQQQQEAVDRLRDLADRFAAMGDTTTTER